MIWPTATLGPALAALWPGLRVEVVPQVDSTNTELMRRARHDPAAVLLVAEHQTAGRGRLGRVWQGQPGHTLMFSLGLPLAPASWSGLSLAVGLSLAHSLDPQGQQRVQLKWPNDLWLARATGWAKLGGILIETAHAPQAGKTAAGGPSSRYCVIGVGLNLLAPHAADWDPPAVGWNEVDPQADAPSLLTRVAEPLVREVLQFVHGGFVPLQNAFNARDALAGRRVRLSDGRQGRAHGVDEQGALRVQTDQGLETVHAADVSVRPE